MKKKYYIYRIINKINGHDYIGQKMYHKYKSPLFDGYYGSGKNILIAIKKYGIDNFKKEILVEKIFSKEKTNLLEKRIIKKYKDKGLAYYNISKGGDGGNNVIWTEERRNEVSKRFKGKHPSLETREKMSKNNGMLGKHHTIKTRKKISKNRKGIGHPHTEEEKIKIGLKSKENNNARFIHTPEVRKKAAMKMKGRFWVNDGSVQKLVYVIPNGFVKGKLNRYNNEGDKHV